MRGLILFLIPTAIFATDYTRDFLDPGFGARAMGMGYAFVAIADDATGFYWNPAGKPSSRTAGLMHAEDFGGIVKYNYGSLILSEPKSALGFALYNIRVDDIKFTTLPDSNEEVGSNNRPEVVSTEMSLDYVLYLNHVRSSENFAWGGNLKLIYRDLVVVKGYGVGCDLGLMLRKQKSRLGLAIKDIILSPIYYDSKRWENLSPVMAAGFATDIQVVGPGRLTPSIEIDKYFDEDLFSYQTKIGVEYVFNELLACRLGFKQSLFTFGLGLAYKQFILDYAVLPGHSLGVCHRISGGITF